MARKTSPSTTPDSGLFEHALSRDPNATPLSSRMRPRGLDELVGQPHLLGEGKLLRALAGESRLPSLVLWGPPGTGKTSIAQAIAREGRADFVTLSAVLTGVPELRTVIAAAESRRMSGGRTLLFVDEIHRWSRAQQDALLPHVERGTITLIGATTENPSFAVNAALLSRARVLQLSPLTDDDLVTLLKRAWHDTERGLGALDLQIGEALLATMASAAQGDARRALDTLETSAHIALARGGSGEPCALREDDVVQALAVSTLQHDKRSEAHYNVTSALIKSMRGSDPDAALYWMMRMLEAGEDPMFVLRRMLIFASEDIGNADPNALRVAVAADTAFQRLGMPEGLHTLGQLCVYLSVAPKSNACYTAWTRAQADVQAHGALPVPLKLRNAPTSLMKQSGYGEGYRYPHDEGGFAEGETYLPDKLRGRRYYEPTQHGIEAKIAERLARLRRPKSHE